MATQDRPMEQDPRRTTRNVYGILLVLAVIAVLLFAARMGFPSTLGIEREPAETEPAGQRAP